MFHKGNIILCSDDKILAVMRKQKFRHRSLEAGLPYHSPPSIDPSTVDFDVFNDKLTNSQRGLGAALTIDCNVGGDISTLICKNLAIDKEGETSEANSKKIYEELKKILYPTTKA